MAEEESVVELRRALFAATTSQCQRLPARLAGAATKGAGVQCGALLVPALRLAGQGRVMLPLQHCLAARNSGLADRRVLLLVLSGCLKIDCKSTRTQVYAALATMLESAEDLLEFVFYHRKVFRKRPHGMGSGMRRLLKAWYLKMDPFDLAVEVLRCGSRHRWSHSDLIQLARVTSHDPARAAVLMTCVRGLDTARLEFGARPEAQPILAYMDTVQQVKREKEPAAAVALIEKHSFDMDILPSELQEHSSVWEAALARLPLRRVLDLLRPMARRGWLAAGGESVVLRQLLLCLRDSHALALRTSGLQPAEIMAVATQADRRWAPLAGQDPAANPVPECHPELLAALEALVQRALPNVPRAAGRVLLAVDCRPSLATNTCWGAPGLLCSRAAALTVLGLRAGGAEVEVVTRAGPAGGLVTVAVGPADTVASLAARLAAVPEPLLVEPLQVVTWALERARPADLLLHITDSHTEVRGREALWARLEEYRAVVPGAGGCRLLYSVLGSKELLRPVAGPGDTRMFDLCGWDASHLRIVQAFLTGLF